MNFHAHTEFARHDRRRHQPAASDRDDGFPMALAGQTPGERPGIAMKLIPGNGKCLRQIYFV